MVSGETHRNQRSRELDTVAHATQRIDSDLLTRIEAQLERADDSDREVPPRIGKWTIRSRIGAGAMGTVFRGFCSRSGELAAIKVSMPDTISQSLLREEAKALDRVQHPAIPKLLDAGEVDGTPYIAVEFVDGLDLAQRIAAASPTGRDAIAWIRDVARGAHALHRAGLVHRDIKPANIVVDDDGRAFLLDLGLAVGSGTSEASLVGTLLYMAPEQLLRELAPVSPATDVYALASSLHHALTGSIWTTATSIQALAHEISYQSPPIGPWTAAAVPRSIGPTLRRALQKDPRLRHRSAAEFADELDSVLRGTTTASMTIGERWRHRASRHRASLTIVSTVAIALAAFAWFTENSRAAERDRIQIETLRARERGEALTNAQRDALLQQARAALSRDDPVTAAKILRDHAAHFAGDEVYASTRREAIYAAAPRQLENLLASISLTVPAISAGFGYQHLVDDARADLEVVGASPPLILLIALHAYLRGDPSDAIAIIGRHETLLDSNQLAADVRDLIALHDRSIEVDRAFFDRLLDDTDLSTSANKCLRGLVILRAVSSMLARQDRADDVRMLLHRTLDLAQSILRSDQDHRCALTLESLAHLSSEQPWAAIAPLTILENGSLDTDEPGIRIALLIAELAKASEPGAPPPDLRVVRGRLAAALSATDDNASRDAVIRHVSDWLAARIAHHTQTKSGSRIRAASGALWLATVEPEALTAACIHHLIRHAAYASLESEEPPDAVRAFAQFVRTDGSTGSAGATLANVHEYAAWASLPALGGALRNEDLPACRDLCTNALADWTRAGDSRSKESLSREFLALHDVLDAFSYVCDDRRDASRKTDVEARTRAALEPLAPYARVIDPLLQKLSRLDN